MKLGWCPARRLTCTLSTEAASSGTCTAFQFRESLSEALRRGSHKEPEPIQQLRLLFLRFGTRRTLVQIHSLRPTSNLYSPGGINPSRRCKPCLRNVVYRGDPTVQTYGTWDLLEQNQKVGPSNPSNRPLSLSVTFGFALRLASEIHGEFGFVIRSHIIERGRRQSTIFARNHKCFANDDARRPFGERRFPFERVQMNKRFLKTLPYDVLGILSVAGYMECHGEDFCLVTFHQNPECSTLTTLAGCDQN